MERPAGKARENLCCFSCFEEPALLCTLLCVHIPGLVYFCVIITIKMIHLFKENMSIEEWVEGSFNREAIHIYTYLYADFLLYRRNQHNIVKWLYSNKKPKRKKRCKLKNRKEVSGGEGGGRGNWHGEYMYIHGWFMSVYDKNHYNIVK